MAELPVEPLAAWPIDWIPEDMWAWVNRTKPHLEAGLAKIGTLLPMLDGDGALRPVHARFDRPALVKTEGYSWNNHLADEMLYIAFLPDRIELRVVENLPELLLARLVPMAGMARLADELGGRRMIADVPVSLGDSDWGKDCLAFSSQLNRAWLIPDPYFFLTGAYSIEKKTIASLWQNWSTRETQLYWRGAPSGMQKYADHALSQRVRVVMHGAESPHRQRYNVRFASLSGVEETVAERIRTSGGLSGPEPQMNIMDYRYNLDVDGWSCAWTGLFIKLLAGSPVLKIESDLGFRQWFYDKLAPWSNFVPVARDLKDLEHCLDVLEARPDIAEQIGEAGKVLANSLTFESQFEAGAVQMRSFAAKLAN